MTDMPIELDPHSAPGQTKYVDAESGASVRVLATDCGGPKPVVAVIYSAETEVWCNIRYPADGTGLHLRQRKPREWSVNLYSDGSSSCCYKTREEADDMAGSRRIACIRVREVLEGDDD